MYLRGVRWRVDAMAALLLHTPRRVPRRRTAASAKGSKMCQAPWRARLQYKRKAKDSSKRMLLSMMLAMLSALRPEGRGGQRQRRRWFPC